MWGRARWRAARPWGALRGVDEAGQDAETHGSVRGSRRPAAHGLRRGRLLARLRAAERLTVVVAPAGSGKTTLLAQHVEHAPGAVVWYRAGRQDGDAARLAEAVLWAAGAAALREPLPRELAENLTAAGTPVTLVVDDAHLLLDTPAEDYLERLVAEGPDGLSVLLASRRAPGVNLCRAELGEVTVVTADDLRFRSWEVESLFRDHYREPLPPDDIAALTRRTDGWAACLRLFQLSTRARPLPERRRAVGALAGGPRYARSYLARTILDELPDDLRTFLARTAVFEVLTAERCGRLLGARNGEVRDAQVRLEQLERLEALTTSDDDGRTFRYHEVLRGHLESALVDELGPDRTRAWYATAAALLEEQGAPGEALRAWLRAERWAEVTRLLREDGRSIAAEPARVGPAWPDLLPPAVVDEDPWLSTAVARRLAAEGRLGAAALRYRHAEGLFPDSADRERVARERRLVELWTTGRPQPHLHWMDRLRDAVHRRPIDVPTDRLRRHPGPVTTSAPRPSRSWAAIFGRPPPPRAGCWRTRRSTARCCWPDGWSESWSTRCPVATSRPGRTGSTPRPSGPGRRGSPGSHACCTASPSVTGPRSSGWPTSAPRWPTSGVSCWPAPRRRCGGCSPASRPRPRAPTCARGPTRPAPPALPHGSPRSGRSLRPPRGRPTPPHRPGGRGGRAGLRRARRPGAVGVGSGGTSAGPPAPSRRRHGRHRGRARRRRRAGLRCRRLSDRLAAVAPGARPPPGRCRKPRDSARAGLAVVTAPAMARGSQ